MIENAAEIPSDLVPELSETMSPFSLRRESRETAIGRSRLVDEEIWLVTMPRGSSPRSRFWRASSPIRFGKKKERKTKERKKLL